MKGKKLNKIITVLLLAFLFISPYNVLAAKKYKVTLNNDGGTGGQSEVTDVKNGSAMPKLSSVPKKKWIIIWWLLF